MDGVCIAPGHRKLLTHDFGKFDVRCRKLLGLFVGLPLDINRNQPSQIIRHACENWSHQQLEHHGVKIQ